MVVEKKRKKWSKQHRRDVIEVFAALVALVIIGFVMGFAAGRMTADTHSVTPVEAAAITTSAVDGEVE